MRKRYIIGLTLFVAVVILSSIYFIVADQSLTFNFFKQDSISLSTLQQAQYPNYNSLTLHSKPKLVLKRNTGLEKYLIQNKSWNYDDINIYINLTINMNRYNWMVDAVANPTMDKCLTVEPIIQEDYPSFDCSNSNHRDLLLSKLGNFTTKGFKLVKAGINQGYINKSGNDFFFTIPLSTLENLNLLQLGEDSIHYEYQNQSRIEYVTDWGASANVTLLEKQGADYNLNVEEVWIKVNSTKFGANHSNMNKTEVRQFLYQVESTDEIISNNFQPYIFVTKTSSDIIEIVTQEKHHFDFNDICSRNFTDNSKSDCVFSFYKENKKYYLNVTFNSDWFIDPSFLLTSFSTINSININISSENNFSHLEISDVAPYDDLVLYMPFNVENTSAGIMYDWSDEGNDGTIKGNAFFNSSGLYGGAMDFDGSGDYVDAGNDLSFNISAGGNITMSAWVKISNGWNDYGYIMTKRNGGSHAYGIYLTDSTRAPTLLGGGSVASVVGETLSVGNWHHIVGVINGTTGRIYINGVLNVSGTVDAIALQATETVKIGARGNSAGASTYFNGSIDEVMIFNTSLTAQQISDIYNNQSARFKTKGTQKLKQFNSTGYFNKVNVSVNNFQRLFGSNISLRMGSWNITNNYNDTEDGVGYNNNGLIGYWHLDIVEKYGESSSNVYDFSGNNNNGTLNGVVSNDNGYYNKGLEFTGSTDRIEINDIDNYILNESGTLSLLAYRKANTVNNYLFSVQPVHSPSIYVEPDGDFYSIGIHSDKIAGFPNNEWVHVVIAWNHTASTVYFNNVLKGTFTRSSISPSGDGNIGAYSGGNNAWNGTIDEVMIFNRTLSSDEITSIYVKSKLNFQYNEYQNLTATNINHTFTITNGTNYLPEFLFLSGNQTQPFYSPILQTSMNFDLYSEAEGVVDNSPVVNLLTPANATSSDAVSEYSFNATITDDINITNATLYIWFENGTLYNTTEWLGIVETTEYFVNSSVNLTIYENYTWNYLAFDNASTPQLSWNDTNYTIEYYESADTILPNIQIVYPSNNTNSSNSGLHVNYTATDNIALDECWYTNDTFTTNYSLTNCQTNITTITWSEGTHVVIVYGNDTTGNINSSQVTFNIDTILPNVQIILPVNNSNTTDTQKEVNYTYSDDNIDKCWWGDGSANTTIACGTNITGVTWNEGLNNITIYANDSMNNVNSSYVQFRLDTTAPTLTLANQSLFTNETLGLQIGAIDIGIGLDGFAINWTTTFSIDFTIGNITNTSAIFTGEYWINVSANDTLGNIDYGLVLVNVTNSTIFVDTTLPTFDNPRNITHTSNTSLSESFAASDDSGISVYTLNDTSVFNVTQNGLITNITNVSTIKIHWLNLSVNDTLDNQASLIFFINITLPPVGGNCSGLTNTRISRPAGTSPYVQLCYGITFLGGNIEESGSKINIGMMTFIMEDVYKEWY